MKVKSILKKGITLSLVTAIAGQSLQANPLEDSLLNVSKGGTITERDSSGNIARTTYTTPSLYFKFGGPATYPEPIVNVGAPSIKAGCGGLSIKGMFGSIIGLDRLASMLKNAGASLAWGVAVGLIYSLPGIGSAFKMINNWAKKIQQLLANACQSGQALGQAMADSLHLNDNSVSNAVADWDNAVAKLDQQMTSKLKEFKIGNFSFNDNMVLQMDDDNTPSQDKVIENYKQLLINSVISFSITNNFISSLLRSIGNTNANTFIQLTFGGDPDPFTMWDDTLTYSNDIDGISLTTDLGINGLSINRKSEIYQKAFKVVLLRDLTGDLELSGAENLEKTLNDMKELISETNAAGVALTTDQKADFEKSLMELVNGESKSWGTTPPMGPLPQPDKNYLTSIADLIYYGGDSNQSNLIAEAEDHLEKLNGLSYGMIAFKGLESDGANARILVIYSKANNENIPWYSSSDLTFTTGGVLKQSKEAIDTFLTQGTIDESATAFPIIVPGLSDKLRILQQTPKNKQEFYKDILAKYNAYQVLKTTLGGLFSEASAQGGSLPVIWTDGSNIRSTIRGIKISDEQQETYSNFISQSTKRFESIMKNLNEHIDKDFGKDVLSPKDLNDYFDTLNIENAKRILRNGPSRKR